MISAGAALAGPPPPGGRDRTVDVVVVGGGLAGLAAAWDLRDLDLLVLEAEHRIGGRLKSVARGDVWLNFGAHVFSGSDSAAGRLITEAGVEARGVPGRLAALELGGKLLASGRVESFPFRLPMAMSSRWALIRSGARLRLAVARYAKVAAVAPGEDPSIRQQRILDFLSDRSFSDQFGPMPSDVDGIFRATLTRSSGEPEELAAGYGVGYFHLVWNRTSGLSRGIIGGPSALTAALAAALDGRIRIGTEVVAVRVRAPEAPPGPAVTVDCRDAEGTYRLHARAAVVATPAFVTSRIVTDLPPGVRDALQQVRYGPYVVGAVLTEEPGPQPWDGLYAVATPDRAFSMIFNIANVLRDPRRPPRDRIPQGSFMVYAAADRGRAMMELPDDEIAARFVDDLAAVFPAVRDKVRETVVQRWPRGLPYPHVGRAALQSALTTPIEPLFLAGDYLGTWYTETAAATAAQAAAGVRQLISRR